MEIESQSCCVEIADFSQERIHDVQGSSFCVDMHPHLPTEFNLQALKPPKRMWLTMQVIIWGRGFPRLGILNHVD